MKKMLFIAFIGLCNLVFSQGKGTIAGVVTDKEMGGESLPFANVFIKGTSIGGTTDIDGKYAINVPAGAQTIVFSFVGYETVEKTVFVKEGQTVIVDQLLGANQGVQLEEVKINASVSREKESALLLEQKKAVAIKTSIGAQELSKKGVSNAAAAVTKTAGVSKGAKNVVVRGLGDRYNSTTLNGLPLPSEDPEYKNISLSFFDTSIIQSVGINKVFSSDINGDVGGANIDIVSKDLRKKRVANLGVSLSGNSQTLVKKNFQTIDGTNRLGIQKLNHEVTDLNTYSFSNSFKPKTQNFQLNNSFSFNYGKKYSVGEEGTLSYFFVGGFSGAYNFIEGNIKQNTNDGVAEPFRDMDFSEYTYNTSQLLMGNLKYKSGKGLNVAYNHLFIHNNKQSVGDYYGKDDPQEEGDLVFRRRQQTNNNELYVNQLLAKYKFNDRLTIEGKGALNFVRGNEPDRRTNNYLTRNGQTVPNPGSAGYNERYFSKLQENDYATKAILSYKLSSNEEDKSVFDLGVDYRYTERLFAATIFNHNFSGFDVGVDVNNPDAIFNQQSVDNNVFGFWTARGRRNEDLKTFIPFTYRGKRLVSGAFSNVVYQLGEKLILSGGVKFERAAQRVTYDTNIARSEVDGPSEIDKTYILPSFNVKYSFNDDNIFRLAVSQTYTYPQFKEIAPFKYQDINFASQGDPNLKPSDNYNIDLKYEHYISSGELISLTGFYKLIKNPIARSEISSAGNTLTYLNVGKDAYVYGVELEARKKLVDNKEKDYQLKGGLNASYLYSRVNLNSNSIAQFQQSSSELEGATPFLLNADLAFTKKYENSEFTSSIVLNYFSDRVYSIGTRGFENIIVKGIPTLDIVSSLRLAKKYSLKLKLMNLLNPEFQTSRGGSVNKNSVVLRNYKKGVNISLGFSYDF